MVWLHFDQGDAEASAWIEACRCSASRHRQSLPDQPLHSIRHENDFPADFVSDGDGCDGRCYPVPAAAVEDPL